MNNVFILGSGFSVQAGAPVSTTALPMIFSFAQYRPHMQKLKDFLDNFLFREETDWIETTSLEEILSRLDLIRYYRPYPGIDYNLVSKYEEILLNEFTGLLFPENLDSQKPPYRKFAALLEHGTTIISFNYDLLAENIIVGEGRSFDYCLQPAVNSTAGTIKLLKLHGSVNTYYCPNCQHLITFSALNQVYQKSGMVTAVDYSASQLTCNYCRERGQQVSLKHFIIAPTLFKSYSIPVLRDLWYLALRTLTEADRMFFIGYSLPEEDILSYQLFDFARKLTVKKQKVILVNGPRSDSDRFHQIYGRHLKNTGLYFEQWIETAALQKTRE